MERIRALIVRVSKPRNSSWDFGQVLTILLVERGLDCLWAGGAPVNLIAGSYTPE